MPRSSARKSFRPTVLLLEGRCLCSFTPVAHTAQFPYSAIVHVTDWFDTNHNGRLDPGDGLAEASAVMIGPDTAITSAHVVYDSTLGGLAAGVSITPGQNGNFRPFGTFQAASWVIPSVYTNPRTSEPVDTASDIAVLNFKPINGPHGLTHIGDLTGWLVPRVYSAKSLQGVIFTNVGYPADTFSGRNQFVSSGPLIASQQFGSFGILRYSNLAISIEAGSSGSPLFLRTRSATVIVGLTEATLVGAEMNLATEITPALNSFIATAEKFTSHGGQIISFNPTTGRSAVVAKPKVSLHVLNAVHAELAHAVPHQGVSCIVKRALMSWLAQRG